MSPKALSNRDFYCNLLQKQIKKCSKCYSVYYILPMQINEDIQNHFGAFGRPLYNLKATKLFKIVTADNAKMEGLLGKKQFKLYIPVDKKLDKKKIESAVDAALASWLEENLTKKKEKK